MTDTNFQEMLNRITPEYLLETQKVLRYIQDELANTKVPAPDGPWTARESSTRCSLLHRSHKGV